MKKRRTHFPKAIALSLALSILMVAVSSITAIGAGAEATATGNTSIHQKVDINDITDSVPAVPMLTSAASSVAKDKQWYEYVYYSEYPVAYYYLNDTTRLSFFDPYDYSSSLVMEVNDAITDWSSNNSMQISYTKSNSLTDTKGNSTQTSTSTLLGYTDTETTIVGANTVTTNTVNKTESYNTSKTVVIHEDFFDDWSVSETTNKNFDAGLGLSIGGDKGALGGELGLNGAISWGDTTTHSWKDGYSQDTEVVMGDKKDEEGNVMDGYTVSTDTTTVDTGEQTTTIINEISDRVTEAVGHSTNSEISLSTTDSTTVTKTYEAGYFNESGSPLQWKIIEYNVKMPMFYQVEYLIDGEWIYGDSSYCLLTTVQGTCRAWMENNVAYYEHWGNGEPVTWDEFWSQFFTEESLIEAYKNRLYPN